MEGSGTVPVFALKKKLTCRNAKQFLKYEVLPRIAAESALILDISRVGFDPSSSQAIHSLVFRFPDGVHIIISPEAYERVVKKSCLEGVKGISFYLSMSDFHRKATAKRMTTMMRNMRSVSLNKRIFHTLQLVEGPILTEADTDIQAEELLKDLTNDPKLPEMFRLQREEVAGLVRLTPADGFFTPHDEALWHYNPSFSTHFEASNVKDAYNKLARHLAIEPLKVSAYSKGFEEERACSLILEKEGSKIVFKNITVFIK